MAQQSHVRLIELPDRKEITLCEAVTAVVYGKACNTLWLNLDFQLEETKEHQIKANDLLGRLQSAAYAGRIKFRALKNGETHSEGHKRIDRLYFGITRTFDWRNDLIWDQDLSEPVGDSTKDWRDVHLDRQEFEALLREMGVSVQLNPAADVPGERKTFTTGMPGRPTSRHLVMELARRRLDAGDYPATLVEFSKQLADELKRAEPKATPMTPKTVGNAIRELWHAHRKPLKTVNPS
jgi:hypothetical protein